MRRGFSDLPKDAVTRGFPFRRRPHERRRKPCAFAAEAASTPALPIPARRRCISSRRSTASPDALRARPVRGRGDRRRRRLCAHGRTSRPRRCCIAVPASPTVWPICTTRAAAATPIVNIVGDQATYHRPLDPPLTADTEGWARGVSGWVRTATDAADGRRRRGRGGAAAQDAPGQIATLILPSDTCWDEGGIIAETLPPCRRRHASTKRRLTKSRDYCAGQPAWCCCSAAMLCASKRLPTGARNRRRDGLPRCGAKISASASSAAQGASR